MPNTFNWEKNKNNVEIKFSYRFQIKDIKINYNQ
jgi:hypothetical protein